MDACVVVVIVILVATVASVAGFVVGTLKRRYFPCEPCVGGNLLGRPCPPCAPPLEWFESKGTNDRRVT